MVVLLLAVNLKTTCMGMKVSNYIMHINIVLLPTSLLKLNAFKNLKKITALNLTLTKRAISITK